jgi:hypothetical protein
MQALFDHEAKANQVYPLINWSDLFPWFKKFQEGVRKSADGPHSMRSAWCDLWRNAGARRSA